MSSSHAKHVKLQFFTRWGSEQIQQIENSIGRYLAAFEMEGVTIINYAIDVVSQTKAQLIIQIKVFGKNVKQTISEFAKKIILGLKAVPIYNEHHAHA